MMQHADTLFAEEFDRRPDTLRILCHLSVQISPQLSFGLDSSSRKNSD